MSLRLRKQDQNQNQRWKKPNSYSKLQTKTFKKDINKKVGKTVRILTYAMKNNMPKIKNKHLIFKTSIAEVKTCLLIDNRSKAKLIDDFFMHTNKILSFKLKEPINLMLGNGKIVQRFIKKAFVDVIIRDYIE